MERLTLKQRRRALERRALQAAHRRQLSEISARSSRRAKGGVNSKWRNPSPLTLRTVAYSMLALAITCEALAHWSFGTFDGHGETREATVAMFPLIAGAAGAPLGVIAALAWLMSRRKRVS